MAFGLTNYWRKPWMHMKKKTNLFEGVSRLWNISFMFFLDLNQNGKTKCVDKR
jgi:hypothetical protein